MPVHRGSVDESGLDADRRRRAFVVAAREIGIGRRNGEVFELPGSSAAADAVVERVDAAPETIAAEHVQYLLAAAQILYVAHQLGAHTHQGAHGRVRRAERIAHDVVASGSISRLLKENDI